MRIPMNWWEIEATFSGVADAREIVLSTAVTSVPARPGGCGWSHPPCARAYVGHFLVYVEAA